jgi:hypothetical protein
MTIEEKLQAMEALWEDLSRNPDRLDGYLLTKQAFSRCLLDGLRLPRGQPHRFHPARRLPFPGHLQHPLKVIIRCSGKGVPNGVDFLDDRVLTRHDQSSFTNFASSITNWEIKSSKEDRVSHQSRVTCW